MNMTWDPADFSKKGPTNIFPWGVSYWVHIWPVQCAPWFKHHSVRRFIFGESGGQHIVFNDSLVTQY